MHLYVKYLFLGCYFDRGDFCIHCGLSQNLKSLKDAREI